VKKRFRFLDFEFIILNKNKIIIKKKRLKEI